MGEKAGSPANFPSSAEYSGRVDRPLRADRPGGCITKRLLGFRFDNRAFVLSIALSFCFGCKDYQEKVDSNAAGLIDALQTQRRTILEELGNSA